MAKNEKIFYIISIVLGAVLVLYYIALKILFGNIAFSSMFFLLGIVLLIYGFIEIRFKVGIWGYIPRGLKIVIKIGFIIGITIFIIVEGIIIYNGNHFDKEKPDYLVVLGAGLRGKSISTSLLYRLESALEFNKVYPDVKIVVSGGQGSGEDISEASAMKNFLVRNGVDERLIITEDKSTSTYENFLFTKNLLEKQSKSNNIRITIISNNFHMYRAKFLAKEVGFKTLGYPAPSHKSSELVFYVREFFGVIKAWVFRI